MNNRIEKQRGVALIVSLVILILVTIAGVATMESTGMQLKMANASRDRQEAFEAAETALRQIEENVNDNIGNLAEDDSMYLDCSGAECFKSDCSGGRCFQGIWRDGDPVVQCLNADPTGLSGGTPAVAPPTSSPWESGSGTLNVWDDAAKYESVSVTGYDNPVKYIVEFRCFVPKDPSFALSDSNYSKSFRITTRGMSDTGRIEVMLQSTYKRVE